MVSHDIKGKLTLMVLSASEVTIMPRSSSRSMCPMLLGRVVKLAIGVRLRGGEKCHILVVDAENI